MTFIENVRTRIFWINTLRIATVFFIAIIIISLLFNNFSSIVKLDFQSIKNEHFLEGRWKVFFFPKIVISLLYGMWVTHRKTK